MANIAMAILLDYFDGEDNCERKARSLSRSLASKLGGIGSGGRLLLRNKTSWSLNEKQLGDIVASTGRGEGQHRLGRATDCH